MIQTKDKQKVKQQFKKSKYMGRSQQSIESSKGQFSLNIISVKQQKKKIEQISKQIEQIRKKIKEKALVKKIKEKDLRQSSANANENIGVKSPLKSSRNNLAVNLIQKEINKNIIQEQIQVQTKIKKKRKSSQSSINFYQGQIPTQHNINCINIYHHGPNLNPQSFFMDNDTVSCDTYQMEIGREVEMPVFRPKNNGFRNTLTPNKKKIQKKEQISINQQNNSHVQKKPFCQSAGNKIFSHIVNNLIKPQFMPKKSNIYQDPQQENEKSVSIRKNKIKQETFNEKQDKARKLIESQIADNKKQPSKRQSSSSRKYFGDNLNRMKSLDEFKMHINGLKNMNQLKTAKEQRKITIQMKVKNVLQKTRNAIAMLNKAKNRFKTASTSLEKKNIP